MHQIVYGSVYFHPRALQELQMLFAAQNTNVPKHIGEHGEMIGKPLTFPKQRGSSAKHWSSHSFYARIGMIKYKSDM